MSRLDPDAGPGSSAGDGPASGSAWRDVIGSQFGAAIDMLENAVRACPEGLWSDRAREPQFWYLAFHTLFWLDLYLSRAVEGFAPPAPFTLTELDPAGVMPERAYAKDELLRYLTHGRAKCRVAIESALRTRAARAPAAA